jgi:hypothetical protein
MSRALYQLSYHAIRGYAALSFLPKNASLITENADCVSENFRTGAFNGVSG